MSTANPKAARIARGMTQEALARRVGCSLATVVRCERLGCVPKVASIRRPYLRALGLTEQQVRL